MRIFLSHASEQRSDADRLAIALRARRHTVFLDADDLPAAGDYQTRIERAIAGCDLFCFLISPQSIAPKRFTLSELGIARRRWPNPAGHVLPIMVDKVPIDDVPAYLRAVSILQSEGDLVADVLPAVDALHPTNRWPAGALWAIGAVALVVIASIAGYVVLSPRRARVANQSTATTVPAAIPSSSPSTGFEIPALDRLKSTLNRFVVYMRQVGFTESDDNVTVYLYSKDLPLPESLREQSDSINAFYLNHAVYVHVSMSGDMSVFLREYSHHVLEAGTSGPIGASAVESGLADYFPASFLGSPFIGEGLGPLFRLRTSYIRRVDNALVYSDVQNEPHARGEVWAGALWTCRQELGQADVDRAPAKAWLDSRRASGNVEGVFGKALLNSAVASRACLLREMERRKIPMGK